MREAAALADTYNISYVQDMTIIVSLHACSTLSVTIIPSLRFQALCGGWPVSPKTNATGQELPLNTSLLLVTSDFDGT